MRLVGGGGGGGPSPPSDTLHEGGGALLRAVSRDVPPSSHGGGQRATPFDASPSPLAGGMVHPRRNPRGGTTLTGERNAPTPRAAVGRCSGWRCGRVVCDSVCAPLPRLHTACCTSTVGGEGGVGEAPAFASPCSVLGRRRQWSWGDGAASAPPWPVGVPLWLVGVPLWPVGGRLGMGRWAGRKGCLIAQELAVSATGNTRKGAPHALLLQCVGVVCVPATSRFCLCRSWWRSGNARTKQWGPTGGPPVFRITGRDQNVCTCPSRHGHSSWLRASKLVAWDPRGWWSRRGPSRVCGTKDACRSRPRHPRYAD